MSLIYEKYGRKQGPRPYLNSGSFIGRAGDLKKMLREISNYHAVFASDQV